MGASKCRCRRRVEPTEDWEQIVPLCLWPEQRDYEEIRPTTLFGVPVSERAGQTGSSERTHYRKVARFEAEGVDWLFAAEGSKRRLVVDLKAEHPPMRPHDRTGVFAPSLPDLARIALRMSVAPGDVA